MNELTIRIVGVSALVVLAVAWLAHDPRFVARTEPCVNLPADALYEGSPSGDYKARIDGAVWVVRNEACKP